MGILEDPEENLKELPAISSPSLTRRSSRRRWLEKEFDILRDMKRTKMRRQQKRLATRELKKLYEIPERTANRRGQEILKGGEEILQLSAK